MRSTAGERQKEKAAVQGLKSHSRLVEPVEGVEGRAGCELATMCCSRKQFGESSVKLWVETRITLEQQPPRYVRTAWTLKTAHEALCVQRQLLNRSYELLKDARRLFGSRRCSGCGVCKQRCDFAQRQITRSEATCKQCTLANENQKRDQKKLRLESSRVKASQVPLPKPRPPANELWVGLIARYRLDWWAKEVNRRVVSVLKFRLRARKLRRWWRICCVRHACSIHARLRDLVRASVMCWHSRCKERSVFVPPKPRPRRRPHRGTVFDSVPAAVQERWLRHRWVRLLLRTQQDQRARCVAKDLRRFHRGLAKCRRFENHLQRRIRSALGEECTSQGRYNQGSGPP